MYRLEVYSNTGHSCTVVQATGEHCPTTAGVQATGVQYYRQILYSGTDHRFTIVQARRSSFSTVGGSRGRHRPGAAGAGAAELGWSYTGP